MPGCGKEPWTRTYVLFAKHRSKRLMLLFFGLDVVKFARSSQIHLDLKVTP